MNGIGNKIKNKKLKIRMIKMNGIGNKIKYKRQMLKICKIFFIMKIILKVSKIRIKIFNKMRQLFIKNTFHQSYPRNKMSFTNLCITIHSTLKLSTLIG